MRQPVQMIFVVSAALLFYVYLGYPLLLGGLSLLRPRGRRRSGGEPMLSVLIAAHNEESSIKKKLAATLSLEYPADKLEVLVLSDGSDRSHRRDRAARSRPARRLFAREPRGRETNAQNFAERERRTAIFWYFPMRQPSTIRRRFAGWQLTIRILASAPSADVISILTRPVTLPPVSGASLFGIMRTLSNGRNRESPRSPAAAAVFIRYAAISIRSWIQAHHQRLGSTIMGHPEGLQGRLRIGSHGLRRDHTIH